MKLTWLQLSPTLKKLTLYIIFVRIGTAMFQPLLSPHLRSIGFSESEIGMFFSIIYLTGFIASLLSGFMSETLGRQRILIITEILFFFSVGIIAWFSAQPLILIAAFLWGLTKARDPIYNATVADSTSENNRATVYGILDTLGVSAQILMPLLGGYIAVQFSSSYALTAALPFLAIAAYLASRIPFSEKNTVHNKLELSTFTDIIPILKKSRAALGMLFIWFIIGLENGILGPTLYLFLEDRYGLDYLGLGMAGTIGALATASILIFGGIAADRYGRQKLIVISNILTMLVIVALALGTTASWAFIMLFLFALVGNLIAPAISALQMEIVEEEYRPKFAGLYSAATSLGLSLGSLASGYLYVLNYQLPLFTAAFLEIVLGIIVITMIKEQKNKAAD